MKKLLVFAAAMTIVGGAFAQCADEPEDKDCAMVYDLKLSVQTTVPNYKETYTGNPCGDDTIAVNCFRKKGKASLEGLLWTCECACNALEEAELILWDKKAKEEVDADMEWQFVNIIGKKQKEVEAAWVLAFEDGEVMGAGFGKYDKKKKRVKSIKGYFAGSAEPPVCYDYECEEIPAAAYICTDLSEPITDLPTVAFGKWSVKYNKSKSKKMTKDWDAY